MCHQTLISSSSFFGGVFFIAKKKITMAMNSGMISRYSQAALNDIEERACPNISVHTACPKLQKAAPQMAPVALVLVGKDSVFILISPANCPFSVKKNIT